MNGNYSVKVNGTVSVAGVTKANDASASDIDEGYTVEIRIPWSYFGFDKNPITSGSLANDFIGIAFGHRDVKSPQYRYSYAGVTQSGDNIQNNSFYNGMHYIGRDEVATSGLNPLYYSRLYLRGNALGVDLVNYSDYLILDGYMEDEFWSDAQTIPYGLTTAGAEVDARVKYDTNGIYIGVFVADSQLVAEPRSFHGSRGIKYNDRLDLRIADSETLLTESMPKAVKGEENTYFDWSAENEFRILLTCTGRSNTFTVYVNGELAAARTVLASGPVGFGFEAENISGSVSGFKISGGPPRRC